MSVWDAIIKTSDQQIDFEKDEKRKLYAEYGAVCPQCGSAKLSFNGKLNLICPTCGYESMAGYT